MPWAVFAVEVTTPDGYKVLHADRSIDPPRIRTSGAVDVDVDPDALRTPPPFWPANIGCMLIV